MPPGGSTCSVACCRNYSEKGKLSETEATFIFQTFPRDPQLRKEWIRRCYRKDNFTPLRMCSYYFKPSDYEDEMRGRLMGFIPRKLKKDGKYYLLCEWKIFLSFRLYHKKHYYSGNSMVLQFMVIELLL